MKICFLTQTASDVSEYYKNFFRNRDFFFITFKKTNPNAIDFVPNSTWADGRNRLWKHVEGKYDYYVFLDDDLIFNSLKSAVRSSPIKSYLYYLITRRFTKCYTNSDPNYFFTRLEFYLKNFSPEVLAVSQLDDNPVNLLDIYAMRKNSFVRRMGFFDAQFTVFSNYAASKLLPYDSKISGWLSSQVPVYLYSFHVFASKAINVSELGVKNSMHVGAYVKDYNGLQDIETMIEEISSATNRNYHRLAPLHGGGGVDYMYGQDEIRKDIPISDKKENYYLNYRENLEGLESLLHPHLKI